MRDNSNNLELKLKDIEDLRKSLYESYRTYFEVKSLANSDASIECSEIYREAKIVELTLSMRERVTLEKIASLEIVCRDIGRFDAAIEQFAEQYLTAA